MNFDFKCEFLRYLPHDFKISNFHTSALGHIVPSMWNALFCLLQDSKSVWSQSPASQAVVSPTAAS